MAVVGSAGAEERGLYLGLGGGASFLEDIDGKAGGSSGHLESDTGWLALGVAGYSFSNGLRAEVEGAYRRNSADSARGIVGSGAVGGSIAAASLMTDVLYDFDLGMPVRPYLGTESAAGARSMEWRRASSAKSAKAMIAMIAPLLDAPELDTLASMGRGLTENDLHSHEI